MYPPLAFTSVALEIISFLQSETMDYNEDGEYNLRDILHENSPFINGDDDIIVMQNELDDLQVKFDYVDRCLKNILERQWHIKNVIEWRKFTSGIS